MYQSHWAPPRLPLLELGVACLLFASCAGESTTAETVHYSTTAVIRPVKSIPFTEGEPGSFFLHAIDQPSDGTMVTVQEAVVTGSAGWVVVHADDNGAPGAVIGISAQLPPGRSSDVPVLLRAPLEETVLVHPMLHLEDNQTITCEFPAADQPVKVDRKLVVSPITVSVGPQRPI